MANQAIDMLNDVFVHAKWANLTHHHTEDEALGGRTITLEGQELVNFGSCSVLGLEYHDALKAGVVDAVARFGTQFSSSRTYASVGLYAELERTLEEMFEKPVIVSASTTLGHLAAIPTLVGDHDAVVMDMQVHSSLQMTSELLKGRGVTVTIVRHNDMHALEKKIGELKSSHERVWYFADGVYSMYGDYAPFEKLQELLDRFPQFHLYIDDAHGMSWTGDRGVGVVRSKMPHHERMVLAVSLNKSFGAAGGCLVFPDGGSRDLVRNCGGTLIFSGPIQPPMLGAAVASARMHLNGELAPLQARLAELSRYTNRRLKELGLPQFEESDSPLFFVPVGMPRIAYKILGRMKERGFYMNPAAFPATPMKRAGVRFLVNLALTEADVDAMLDNLLEVWVTCIAEDGGSPEQVAKTFRIPSFSPRLHVVEARRERTALKVEVVRSVRDVDSDDWNRTFAGKGNFTTGALRMIEEVFTRPEAAPENRWDFYYLTVRDGEGRKVLSTFFTCAIVKEDMFHPSAVSQKIEAQRASDPYFMTTRAVVLGSLVTKGEHLHLDRTHPQWKEGLRLLIDAMQETVESSGAGQLLLREFMGEQDPEFQKVLQDLGLVRQALPNVCMVRDLSWKDEAEYMARLGGRYRSDLRREVIKHRDHFVMTAEDPTTEADIRACYALYEAVFSRSFEMNVFKLPFAFFRAMCMHPEYEVIRLYLKDGDRPVHELPMVGVMFSHVSEELYSAMMVGLDYARLAKHEVYKQILYRTVWQAWRRGCSELDLAFTADMVKKKVGARPHAATAYLQVMDHYNQSVLATMQKAA